MVKKFMLVFLAALCLNCGSREKRSENISAQRIAAHLQTEFTGEHYHDLDVVRRFVHDNSSHDLTQNFTLPVNEEDTTRALYNRISQNTDKPIMYCGHRAYAFSAILKELGYKVRVVNVVSTRTPGTLEGHIFPEVLSPEGKWEIIDPDYDVYYLGTDGKRAGVTDIIYGDKKSFLQCVRNTCGYDQLTPEGFSVNNALDLFDGALINTSREFFVNERFDLDSISVKGKSARKYYVDSGRYNLVTSI